MSGSDDFFALGGHSLLCARVTGRLSPALGVRVPISLLFDHPVLDDLAVEVEKLRTGQVGNGDQEIPRDVSQ